MIILLSQVGNESYVFIHVCIISQEIIGIEVTIFVNKSMFTTASLVASATMFFPPENRTRDSLSAVGDIAALPVY